MPNSAAKIPPSPEAFFAKGTPGSEIATFNARSNTVQHVETEVQVTFVHPEQFQPPTTIDNDKYQGVQQSIAVHAMFI